MIWLEIHCDQHLGWTEAQRAAKPRLENRCYSDRNENVAGAANNTQAGILELSRQITFRAFQEGWKYHNAKGWICPDCFTEGGA